MAPVQDLDKEAPDCPCCGARMDSSATTFGTRMTIDGFDYYCNNPACYCHSSQKKTEE